MDKLDKLYQNYDILADPKNKPSEHEAEFLEIIESVKGDSNEKIMACQFIPRFFKDFPNLSDTALDAQLDLVEDPDIAVRKHAVKYLPSFCKESNKYVTKISDILTQMLQSGDSGELSTVQTTLMNILKLDAKATLDGIFMQITSTQEDVIRKRAIQFLCTKFKFLPPEMTNKEVEEFVLEKCKQAFPEIGGDDFLTLFPLLSNLKIAKTVPIQQSLVNLIAEQAELDVEFQPSADNVAGFLQCVRLAMPYFSSFIQSTPFVIYICLFVLPKLSEIEQLESGEELSLDVIKMLAEVSVQVSKDEQIDECCDMVYKNLLEYIPQPPENVGSTEEPNLQFTHIECLMYTFTNLLKLCPNFLTSPENSARFKDLKSRLQFLARGVQSVIKTFRESLIGSSKTAESTKVEDTKMKAIALRTMNNINALIKDLFRTPPSFKTTVTLSWKPVSNTSSAKVPITVGIKRQIDSSGLEESKMPRKDMKTGRDLYVPPGGKFSTNISPYNPRPKSNFFPRGRGRRY